MFKKIMRVFALLLILGNSCEIQSHHGGGGHGGGGHGGGGFHGGGHAGAFHGGGHGWSGGHGGSWGHGGWGHGGRGWGYGGWGWGGYWGAFGWGPYGPYGWYSPWVWSFGNPWWWYANSYGPTWYTRIEVPTYEVDREQWTDERGTNYWEFYNDTNLAVTIQGPQGTTEIAPKSAEKVSHIQSFKYIALATEKNGKKHKITVNTTKHYNRILYKNGKLRIERY